MVAGQSFLPLLKEAACAGLPLLHGKFGMLSRREIASYLWPALEDGYEENYESRLRDRKENDIWPWYPVAHLAAACQALARLEAGADDGFAFDYQDLDFHLRVAMLAAEFARLFRQVPELSDIAAKLIDIEIVI